MYSRNPELGASFSIYLSPLFVILVIAFLQAGETLKELFATEEEVAEKLGGN